MNELSQDQETDIQEAEQNTETELNEAELKASEQGWTPKEQWNGDPDRWVGADEFLERGEKHNGILRERNEKLISEVHAVKKELLDSVRQFGEATRKAEERAFQRAMKELKAQQRNAVENSDPDAWESLEHEKESLQNEFEKNNKPPEQQYNPDQDPAYISWHEKNKWYNDDFDMTVYANQIAPIVASKLGNSNTPEFYNTISEQVRKKFAKNFRNVNRDAPSPVQGTAQEGGKPGKGGNKYNDLPADAKAACDKFVKQGMMSQEEYVKEYFNQ